MRLLKIDIDDKGQGVEEFIRRLRFVKCFVRITGVDVKETRKGFHFRVMTEEDLEAWEVLVLQAILGSDFKRELFNYLRVRKGLRNWNILFNKKKDAFIESEEKETERTRELRYILYRVLDDEE
jgi:hypothetical protein